MDGLISNSTDRPRTIWTPSMDRFFISLVMDQVRRGNMIDHAFRKQVWVQMTALFNRKFGYRYEKDVLKNRYKSLRRKYNEITTILNQDGFQWDGVRRMLVADDNVWDCYIEGHPEKRSYRTKVLPFYNDLCMIYGNVLAESSRTNSAGASGDVQSPHTPVADRDPVEDAQDLLHLEQDMAHRSTDEGMRNAHCEITSKGKQKNGSEGLLPVEVTFAVEAVPSTSNLPDGNRSKAQSDAQQDQLIRPMQHYDDLCISDDGQGEDPNHMPTFNDSIQVIKNGGNSQGLPSPNTPKSYRDLLSDEQEESSYLGWDMDISNHPNKRLSVAPSASERFKQSRKANDGSMIDALRAIEVAVTSLKGEKKENNNPVSVEKVMAALQAVPDIDEDLLLDACDLLEDEKKAKTFLALDSRLRKKWLLRKLRPAA